MKVLLSINPKHYDVKPKKIIDIIKKYDIDKNIEGFEVWVDVNRTSQKYVSELAKLCKENNYILNLHSPIFEGFDKADKFLKIANELAKLLERKINIVMHLLNDSEEHLKIADKYLNYLLIAIKEKNYDLLISIENLTQKEINKQQLIPFFEKYPELKFTYDMGHEYVDRINLYELSETLIERLNNFHLHSFEGDLDHYPITQKDINFLEKFLKIIKASNFSKTVVLEYSTDYIEGKDMEEKIINYVKSTNIFPKLIKEIEERNEGNEKYKRK